MSGGRDEMESPKSGLDPVGKVVEEALQVCSNPTEVIRQARAGFLEKVAARNAARNAWSHRSPFRRWRLALAAAAAVALVVGVELWSTRPITFRVGGGTTTGRADDLIEAPAGSAVPVHFSEGSFFLLQGGGRARVLATEVRGARVLIDSGDMEVAINHPTFRPGRWNFEAGPFRVQVTGTRFHLAWRPATQRFALATSEGRVMVSASCMTAARAVSAGESVDLSCARGSVLAGPSVVPAEVKPDATPSEAPTASTATENSTPKPSPRMPAWRERIAAGQVADGLRMAERAGFARVCQEASLKELAMLADAARLTGHGGHASEALRAMRQRFPRTKEAATAAFTLGRIAFEQRGAYQEAARWFGTYLLEQPSGPLMGDSVGRLMEARQRAGDMAGARQDAERYLRRFPEGPYASEARAILQNR
jgi:transmembrane sensor